MKTNSTTKSSLSDSRQWVRLKDHTRVAASLRVVQRRWVALRKIAKHPWTSQFQVRILARIVIWLVTTISRLAWTQSKRGRLKKLFSVRFRTKRPAVRYFWTVTRVRSKTTTLQMQATTHLPNDSTQRIRKKTCHRRPLILSEINWNWVGHRVCHLIHWSNAIAR